MDPVARHLARRASRPPRSTGRSGPSTPRSAGCFFGLIGATVLRHMVAAPVQLALRQLRTPGQLAPALAEPAPLEPQRLTWAQLLDAATCVRCGRCTAVCPATAAGKPLDPRRVVQATLQAMREGRPLESLVSPEEAWSCTTCAACVRACPFEIEVLDKLVDLRRTLVEAGAVDAATARALEATVERGNPFGGVPADRRAWAADLGVREIRPGEATDVLYWVGCAGAFDPHGRRSRGPPRGSSRRRASSSPSSGSAETCTGDPARRIGDETAFREAAGRVAGTLGGVRFQRLLTHCAHCFNVFRNELGPATDGSRRPDAPSHPAPRGAGGGGPPRAAGGHGRARDPSRPVLPRSPQPGDRGAAGRPRPPRTAGRSRCRGAASARSAAGRAAAAPGSRCARARGSRRSGWPRRGRPARRSWPRRVPFCALMLAGETQPGGIAVRDVAELLWESQPAARAAAPAPEPS